VLLILGGTAEARELATALHGAGAAVTSSLAGRVSRPRLPRGDVRVGGFGGPDGLAAWLRERGVAAVLDATHPFAARISASAARACPAAGVPLLRLERPGFAQRLGDHWHRVPDLPAAATLAPELGRRVFLTTGRGGLAAFAGCWFLIRCVDPPPPPLPRRHELILARGPFTLRDELALIDRHRLDLLITKDSGGAATEAKLDAARERGLPVIVVDRPPRPPVATVGTVAEALSWALAHAGRPLAVQARLIGRRVSHPAAG
jgi:precorrin-6A/cobalt-precorrin-6A reductase